MNDDPFAGRLLAHETVLWSGRPLRGLMLTKWDLGLIPFSLMWGGFAIFWEAMAVTQAKSVLMAVWGVPFVLIGMFVIFGRLPFDAWLRTKIHYALTDRRVLILRRGAWGSLQALALDRLPDVTLSERADGRGTIRFSQGAVAWGNYGWAGWLPALDPVPQFLAIPDAGRVFRMIQEAEPPPSPEIEH